MSKDFRLFLASLPRALDREIESRWLVPPPYHLSPHCLPSPAAFQCALDRLPPYPRRSSFPVHQNVDCLPLAVLGLRIPASSYVICGRCANHPRPPVGGSPRWIFPQPQTSGITSLNSSPANILCTSRSTRSLTRRAGSFYHILHWARVEQVIGRECISQMLSAFQVFDRPVSRTA